MKFAIKLAFRASAIIFVLLMVELPVLWAGEIHDVTILQRNTLNEGNYTLRLTVALGNRQEHLLLKESHAFNDLQVIQSGQPDTQSRKLSGINSYQGVVEDIPNSWVRVTTDSNHISGVIDTGTERHFITSDSKVYPDAGLRQIRRLIQAVDQSIVPPPESLPERNRSVSEVIEIDVNNGFGNQPDLVTRVARIAIVVDTLYDEALGGRGLAEAISTINTVDGMYQQEFGLALKVDTAIIITDTTTLGLGSVSLEENLSKFRDYRQSAAELDADLGLVHLFTGVSTSDPSVGLAYIGAVCRRDGYDVSMSTPFDFPVLLAAHEIGHNLGAVHDDETELCTLTTDQLMFSHISGLTTNEFSSCTTNAINKRLDQSACHLDAIDLSLTLSRNGETGIIALITNTDTQRAFPSALFKLNLKNASIAAAPASCEISSTTELDCTIPTTYPGEDHSLEIELRFDDVLENTLDASLNAIGFIDIKTVNNHAQIIVPAQPTSNPPISIANNDDSGTGGSNNPTTNPAVGGNGATPSAASSGGGSGSVLDLIFMLLSLLVLPVSAALRSQSVQR